MIRTVALAVALPAVAAAVPLELTHTGRLLDASGAGINGSHSVVAALYDDASDSAALWASADQSVHFTDGYYTLTLGDDGSLSPDLFDRGPLWLAVDIDGAPIGPRSPIASVPFAIRAQSAATVSPASIDATALSADAASLDRVSDGALSVSGDDDATTVTVDGWLASDRRRGPHGYTELTTNIVAAPENAARTYTLLDMRCSGHWGGYYAEIELVTSYFNPTVRRYEYSCGNSNHTTGGVLVERASGASVPSAATLTLSNRGYSGSHNGQSMYDARLIVHQAAYVRSYARVRVYSTVPNHGAGASFSPNSPSAIWPTWSP